MPAADLRPATRLLEARIAQVRAPTPRIREFTLERADGAALPPFEAGSHIELHWQAGDGPLIRRYSLLPGDAGEDRSLRRYRIAVQREGRGSGHLHDHAVVGTRLAISQPRHEFRLDRRDVGSLLVAGGIGITPLWAMAHSLARRQRPFDLVYAGRSEAVMAYLPELRDLCGPRLRIHARDTQPARLDLPRLLAAQPDGTTVYVCGPASLVHAAHKAAGHLGWAPQRVRSETFGPPALASPTPFTVELRRSGRTLEVSASASILETMQGARLQPLFDCGRGECGLCTLPVLQADGPLLHRDHCLTEAQRTTGDSLCICVSRVQGSQLVLDA